MKRLLSSAKDIATQTVSSIPSASTAANTVKSVVESASTVNKVMNTFKFANNAKKTVDSILHPVEWFRDQVKNWVLNQVKSLLLCVVKEAMVEQVCNKVENYAYAKQLKFSPPSMLKPYMYTDEGLLFLNNTVSMLFNDPLFAVGMKLGRVHFSVEEDLLSCAFEFRLHSTQKELEPLHLRHIDKPTTPTL